jgi:hypothetical protein
MADGGGSGGVQRGPELLGHRRWMGGIEGGAVEERMRHAGVDEGDGRRPVPFMAAQWHGREKGAGGSGVEGGGQAASCGHAARGGAGGGGGCGARHEVEAATVRERRFRAGGVRTMRRGERERRGTGRWAARGKETEWVEPR